VERARHPTVGFPVTSNATIAIQATVLMIITRVERVTAIAALTKAPVRHIGRIRNATSDETIASLGSIQLTIGKIFSAIAIAYDSVSSISRMDTLLTKTIWLLCNFKGRVFPLIRYANVNDFMNGMDNSL